MLTLVSDVWSSRFKGLNGLKSRDNVKFNKTEIKYSKGKIVRVF